MPIKKGDNYFVNKIGFVYFEGDIFMQILEIKKEIGILLEDFDYHYNKERFEEINKAVKDKLDQVDRSLLWMWSYG